MSIRRTGIFLLLMAAVSFPIPGMESPPVWNIGVAAMPAGPAAESGSFRASILGQLPVLVIERLRDLELRFMPREEALRRLERSRLENLYSAGAKAAALRDRRDSAALSPASRPEREAEESRLSGEYARSRKEDGAPEGDGPPADSLVVALWEGHASGRLVEATEDLDRACAREKLDYLILWEVREVSGYLRIRMTGWNAVLGRPDFSHTAYCPADDIPSAAEELAQALILAASARPSSRLEFDVEPPESRILVDGRLLAAGRRSLRVYEEREYAVSVEIPGGAREDFTLRSEFGKDVRLAARLARPASPPAIVESEPPGASLYLDGIWAGITPAEAEGSGAPRVAQLILPGYEDEFLVIDPRIAEGFAVSLRKAEDGSIPLFEQRKERFYAALGRLAVSLPLSLLAYGVYLQSAALHLEYPGNQAFSRRNDVSLAVFAVSGGITAGFLATASARLVKYIQSAR